MLIFSILNHPHSFLVYYYIFSVSILPNYYFVVSLTLKVIFHVTENDVAPLNKYDEKLMSNNYSSLKVLEINLFLLVILDLGCGKCSQAF